MRRTQYILQNSSTTNVHFLQLLYGKPKQLQLLYGKQQQQQSLKFREFEKLILGRSDAPSPPTLTAAAPVNNHTASLRDI